MEWKFSERKNCATSPFLSPASGGEGAHNNCRTFSSVASVSQAGQIVERLKRGGDLQFVIIGQDIRVGFLIDVADKPVID